MIIYTENELIAKFEKEGLSTSDAQSAASVALDKQMQKYSSELRNALLSAAVRNRWLHVPLRQVSDQAAEIARSIRQNANGKYVDGYYITEDIKEHLDSLDFWDEVRQLTN